MGSEKHDAVFDYRTLRFLVGLIAFSLPYVVTIIASTPLRSISVSYHTEAQDIFVGMLFIVGSFLVAYNGHFLREAIASKVAGFSAIIVALVPTSCPTCSANINSTIHYSAAVLLFAILAYFCFGPFRRKIKGKGGKKGVRSKIYLVCGIIMVICMLTALLGSLILDADTYNRLAITFWAEAVALNAFGIAWIVAGKYIPLTTEREERVHLFG